MLFSAEEKLLLITGCGRSGTSYIATLLTQCGLEFGHENAEKNGVCSWFLAVDGPKFRANFPDPSTHYQHVFHQVRNPLDVISSWYFNYEDVSPKVWNNFIRVHVPQIKAKDPPLVRCAKYWYYWNLLAEKKAEWRYRIEDIHHEIYEFEKRLGVVLKKDGFLRVREDINTWKKIEKKLIWADLKEALDPNDFKRIVSLAKKYGYSTKDE